MRASQVEALRRLRFSQRLHAHEIFKVTQWRDGCIYKTRSLGYVVAPPEALISRRDIIICSLPTKIQRQLFT